jgi:hypothetical protein
VADAGTQKQWNTNYMYMNVAIIPCYCKKVLRRYSNWLTEDYIPRAGLGFWQIIFNVPHVSILLHIKDKHTRTMLYMMAQETKQ